MNIGKEFERIFNGEETISGIEKETLMDSMESLLLDVMDGIKTDAMAMKIRGAIEFMSACGRISERQEEHLWMLVNEIESAKAEEE